MGLGFNMHMHRHAWAQGFDMLIHVPAGCIVLGYEVDVHVTHANGSVDQQDARDNLIAVASEWMGEMTGLTDSACSRCMRSCRIS